MMLKKKLVLVFVVLNIACIYANDTIVENSSGGNDLVIGKSSEIYIDYERIQFDLYKDYFVTTIDYDFINEGSPQELEIGFPVLQYDPDKITEKSNQKLENFTSYVNGTLVDLVEQNANIRIDNNESISKFIVKKMKFDKTTHVTNSYSSKYAKYYYGDNVEYLVGSAICWNRINKLDVIVNFISDDMYFNWKPSLSGKEEIKGSNEKVIRTKTNRIYQISFDHPKLSLNTKIKFDINRLSSKYMFGYNAYDYTLDQFLVSENELMLLTKEQLRIARNTIYAWRGYIFKDKDLASFFESTRWYDSKQTTEFNEKMFNAIEKENINRIIKVEKYLESIDSE